MLILSANTLGLSQLDQNSTFSFYGQQFRLLCSHQPRDFAMATCRKCLDRGGMALMVVHDHHDDNSIWQMVPPDQVQETDHQMTMTQVVTRVKTILGRRVF